MSTSDNHAPVDALVSYHYYKRDEDMHAALSSGWLRLIGDSGAFSAFSQGADVKLDEFATAEHGCMTVRGVAQHQAVTTTYAWGGQWSIHHAEGRAVLDEHRAGHTTV